jgi:hypothetical protein
LSLEVFINSGHSPGFVLIIDRLAKYSALTPWCTLSKFF